jgi:hypothetical protein
MAYETGGEWRRTPRPPTLADPEPVFVSTRPSQALDGAILSVAALFFLDTFLAWERACVSFTFGNTPIGACLSANAWQSKGATAGLVAGIACIGLILWQGLGLLRMIERDTLALVRRVLVWGVAAAGAIKWLLVLRYFATWGAWIGFGLLLVLAGLDTYSARR